MPVMTVGLPEIEGGGRMVSDGNRGAQTKRQKTQNRFKCIHYSVASSAASYISVA